MAFAVLHRALLNVARLCLTFAEFHLSLPAFAVLRRDWLHFARLCLTFVELRLSSPDSPYLCRASLIFARLCLNFTELCLASHDLAQLRHSPAVPSVRVPLRRKVPGLFSFENNPTSFFACTFHSQTRSTSSSPFRCTLPCVTLLGPLFLFALDIDFGSSSPNGRCKKLVPNIHLALFSCYTLDLQPPDLPAPDFMWVPRF